MQFLKLLTVTMFCLASCLARAQEPSPHWRDILGPFPQPDELAERYSQGEDAYNAGKYKTALDLWKPAAEFGHADSQHGMCFLYWEGNGVEKDLSKAETWCAKAQRVDEPGHTYHLARVVFENVDGNPTNDRYVRTTMWLVIAANRGSKDAADTLKLFEETPDFPLETLREATHRAKLLVPEEFN